MKLTKHEHAYLDVELQGQHLLVDPGVYNPPPIDAKKMLLQSL
jgi:L-ascorbate metabolism protein UlaG (beta-lactamase superfamily)